MDNRHKENEAQLKRQSSPGSVSPSRAEVVDKPVRRRRTMSFPGFSIDGDNALGVLGGYGEDSNLKNRRNSCWIQLAGHKGTFAPAGPRSVWKKRQGPVNIEAHAYEGMSKDPVASCIPRFIREVNYEGKYFIEMEDLLHHFSDPNIMDVKMGLRTFLESEVNNPVLRKDLYEKMVALSPDSPTAEEHEERAVTKLRYMQLREQMSSTAALGFRIDAIRMSGKDPDTNLKKIRSRDEISQSFDRFLDNSGEVRRKLIGRLEEIRHQFEHSPFFKNHEIVGSSILLLYDSTGKAGAWIIDFGKTVPVEGIALDHRSPWSLGNHADGFLLGLENLLQILQQGGEENQNTKL